MYSSCKQTTWTNTLESLRSSLRWLVLECNCDYVHTQPTECNPLSVIFSFFLFFSFFFSLSFLLSIKVYAIQWQKICSYTQPGMHNQYSTEGTICGTSDTELIVTTASNWWSLHCSILTAPVQYTAPMTLTRTQSWCKLWSPQHNTHTEVSGTRPQ